MGAFVSVDHVLNLISAAAPRDWPCMPRCGSLMLLPLAQLLVSTPAVNARAVAAPAANLNAHTRAGHAQ